VTAAAIRRVIADQIKDATAEGHVSKTEMAKRMNDSVTLNILPRPQQLLVGA
jgi:hypothetical protein